jgi:hypothetical protein
MASISAGGISVIMAWGSETKKRSISVMAAWREK